MLVSSVILALVPVAAAAAAGEVKCPNYAEYAAKPHSPYSSGKYEVPYQRLPSECRLYPLREVEDIVDSMRHEIKDPDLFMMFQNTYLNTLDTTVLWKGLSLEEPHEELAFVVTGDINAMWLRDSANQLQSYKSVLKPNRTAKKNMASLYRGVINLQGRYIRQSPYCNAFQPPPESSIQHAVYKAPSPAGSKDDSKGAWSVTGGGDTVTPPYDRNVVFECKFELDSLAAFLQLSWDYYEATQDADFFARLRWADTVRAILGVASDMMAGTYDRDGKVNKSPYTWVNQATTATETVPNNGAGSPVSGDGGLVRSFFRPSDDSTTFQYHLPANMMFSRYLKACARIMKPIDASTASEMEAMAAGINRGIQNHGVVTHSIYGKMYAYEIDGFGSYNLMDDANIPSLLSIPHIGWASKDDPLYKNTRAFVLSQSNPYYAHGPVINAVGGPHIGPGKGWPMAVLMQIMTSDDDDEIVGGIKQLLGSASGLGLMHESVDSHDDSKWTRSWFAWANALFSQMVLDLRERKPELLARSYQD